MDDLQKKLEEKGIEDKDRMLSPVPMSERRPTWKQILVWVGFGYVVTGLFVGGVLAGFGGQAGLPPKMAFLSVVLGMGSLFLITSFLGIMAQDTGMSLAIISRYSYGMKGANIPMIVMALLTLGWFASITGMIGDIWGSFIGNPSGIIVFDPASFGYAGVPPITLEVFLSCVFAGSLFTWAAYRGIEAIEAIAIPVAPIILIIALWVGIGMLNEGGGLSAFLAEASSKEGLGLGSGITVVIGSWIAGAMMGVDLFRFNKTKKAVFWGAAACFIFTNPLLNVVGYIGSISVGQFNYVEWMLGKSAFLAIIGVLAWTASLWTTNNAELYCNSLYTGPVLATFDKIIERKKLVLAAGILGTIIGSLAFYQLFFADFIGVLGAGATPVVGPLLADYYFIKKRNYNKDDYNEQPLYRKAGVISFFIGSISGIILEYVFEIGFSTGLLALFISMISYLIIYRISGDIEFDEDINVAN